MTFFPDTRLYSLDCSCLSHCSFEDGRFEIKKRPLLSMFCFFIKLQFCMLTWCLIMHAGSNYLRPLFGPLANMLQMLQECSQLELALRVLVNAYGSCLQHVTSNIMDIKLSLQVQLRYSQRCLLCFSRRYTENDCYLLSALWRTRA